MPLATSRTPIAAASDAGSDGGDKMHSAQTRFLYLIERHPRMKSFVAGSPAYSCSVRIHSVA